MDRFTWLMTLFTAALDASMSSTDVRSVLLKIMLDVFAENISGLEFVERETPTHMEGWRSASCVRGISTRASDLWRDLGRHEKHQPGFIPSSEMGEVVNFLNWLIGSHGKASSKRYCTASTDIFCLAVVLQEIGLLIKTTDNQHEYTDESETVVCWSSDLQYSQVVAQAARKRYGMRIPLDHIEDFASVFPADRNELGSILSEVIRAVHEDQLRLAPCWNTDEPPYAKGSPWREEDQDLVYYLTHSSREQVPRLQGDEYRFADRLFVQPTPAVSQALLRVIQRVRSSHDESHNLDMLALTLDNQRDGGQFKDLRAGYNYGDALNYMQVFVLGYWYALLLPLLDITQLPSREALGSWGWSDVECLDFIQQCQRRRMHKRVNGAKVYLMYRYEVLKLVSYLFGGAELSQTRAAQHGALGILGKLPVVYSSLVRGKLENFGKFSLIDVDATCIPSSISGVVLPGRSKGLSKHFPETPDCQAVRSLRVDSLPDMTNDDFTTHIEPDWDYDTQTCLLVYRYKGRMIHRLNPRQIDIVLGFRELVAAPVATAITRPRPPTPDPNAGDDPPYHVSPNFCMVPLTSYFGGTVIHPEERMANVGDDSMAPPGYVFEPLLINVKGSSNAFVCLTCMYHGWKERSDVEFRTVKTQAEFNEAIQDCAKAVILYK